MFDFKKAPSYKIIDHFYNEQKDFIILGLCGRVGSGISTVSGILEKKFDDLQLPQPGFDNPDINASHEYRILYTYAAKNWKPFFKIKTSALITRHILKFEAQDFAKFLIGLSEEDDKINEEKSEEFTNIATEFFNETMQCDLGEYYNLLKSDGAPEIENLGEFLKCNKKLQAFTGESNETDSEAIKFDTDTQVDFKYNSETKICTITNEQMSKMVDAYAKLRHEKSGFNNPFWYLMLQQYLYKFLPDVTTKLWKKIHGKSESLRTHALQCLGNNLRLNKNPYYNEGHTDLKSDAYVCIAEDINLAIKVLRAYQLKIQESNSEKAEKLKNDVKTVIVIDSIKNPYESLYLKARYNNYYLIGVYTEDAERKQRLREKSHLIDDDIKAIDIIEQNTAFKEEIKSYTKWLKKEKEAKEKEAHEKEKKEEEKCKTPSIIRKMYDWYNTRGLLNDLSYISPFILQNVSSCLDSADILINNQTDNKSYTYLKKTLLRYVCLIMNPGLVLPTAVERCMQIANNAKINSGCVSRQVGAVLTDSEYHLLSVGWNQQPEGQVPCSYRNLCELYHHWGLESYSDYENNDEDKFQKNIKEQVENIFDSENSPFLEKGKFPCYCFKDYHNSIEESKNQVHTRALHAEETAFLNLGANRERVANGVLFTTSSPCELCAKKAMFMGISKIYYIEAYAGVTQKHVLNIGKEDKRPELVLFTGATGTAYTKLFTPLIPQKDENEMWLGQKMDIKLMENLAEKSEKTAQNKESESKSGSE